MVMHKGTTRIVFVFDHYVIKIPRLQPALAFKMRFTLHRKKLRKIMFRKQAWASSNNALHYVYGGILANWNEYLFFRNNKDLQILMPVYFSFLGLLNVQAVGERIEIDELDFKRQIDLLTSWRASGSHTFRNPENFCMVAGRLRIVDFGDPRMYDVIKKYGKALYENFDVES